MFDYSYTFYSFVLSCVLFIPLILPSFLSSLICSLTYSFSPPILYSLILFAPSLTPFFLFSSFDLIFPSLLFLSLHYYSNWWYSHWWYSDRCYSDWPWQAGMVGRWCPCWSRSLWTSPPESRSSPGCSPAADTQREPGPSGCNLQLPKLFLVGESVK